MKKIEIQNKQRLELILLTAFISLLGWIAVIAALIHIGVPAVLGDKAKAFIISYLALNILIFISVMVVIVHGVLRGFMLAHKLLLLLILITELFTSFDRAVNEWLLWKFDFNRKVSLLEKNFKTGDKIYVKIIKELEASANGNNLFRLYDNVNSEWKGTLYAYTADIQMAFSYTTGSMSLLALKEYKEAIPDGDYTSPLWDLFNVKYLYLKESSDDVARKGLEPVSGAKGLYINKDALPRAYILTNYRTFDSKPILLNALRLQSNFDEMRKAVYLSQEPMLIKINMPDWSRLSSVAIDKYTAHMISLNADMKTDGYLVLADVWSPQWKAYVNGKEVKILRAYHLLRAIELQKGSHKIKFVYDKNYFSIRIGKTITLVTMLSLIAFLIIRVYMNRRKTE